MNESQSTLRRLVTFAVNFDPATSKVSASPTWMPSVFAMPSSTENSGSFESGIPEASRDDPIVGAGAARPREVELALHEPLGALVLEGSGGDGAIADRDQPSAHHRIEIRRREVQRVEMGLASPSNWSDWMLIAKRLGMSGGIDSCHFVMISVRTSVSISIAMSPRPSAMICTRLAPVRRRRFASP